MRDSYAPMNFHSLSHASLPTLVNATLLQVARVVGEQHCPCHTDVEAPLRRHRSEQHRPLGSRLQRVEVELALLGSGSLHL